MVSMTAVIRSEKARSAHNAGVNGVAAMAAKSWRSGNGGDIALWRRKHEASARLINKRIMHVAASISASINQRNGENVGSSKAAGVVSSAWQQRNGNNQRHGVMAAAAARCIRNAQLSLRQRARKTRNMAVAYHSTARRVKRHIDIARARRAAPCINDDRS
jgi:hypothetical protein